MPLSFRQNIRFKHQPEARIDEFDFVGGLKTDAHETKLKNNESPDMANVIFNDTGSIKTRNGYTRYNGDPIGIASDQANTGASSGSLAVDAIGDYVAQTFIPSGSISCTQVDVYLAMNTSGQEQYVRVELWSTSSGTPSAILTNGTGQIKLVSGTSETAYSFRFRQPVSLSASTTYAIVVKPFARGSSQTVKQVNVYHRGATYANGQVYTSTNAGIGWTGDSAKDLRFTVYSGGNTGSTGLIRFYGDSGVKQLLAKFGATLYRGNDISGAMTAITLGSGDTFNASNFLDWTVSNGALLLVDGEGYIQKYRGSTNANYTTGTIGVTNGSNQVNGTSTVWGTSTNAEAGEYILLPDGKWYKITLITSNVLLTIERTYQGTTTATQPYTISPWGEVQGKLNSSTAPASLVRPTPNFITTHLNRVWTLDGNELRFSVLDTSVDEENFNDWDTSNNAGQINIPGGNGDTGTGLYSMNGYLYIFQKNAIWEIFGSSPNNFELRNISNEIGMIDRRTLVEYENYLIFLSEKGVYIFDGANLKNLTDGVINNLIDSWANKSSAVARLWGNRYILSYTPEGSSYNSEAICYDVTRAIWGKFDGLYASAWSSWNGGTDNNETYFASSNQGSVYKWDTGGNDDGYEIATLYDTPSIGFRANTNDKAAKKLYLQQIATGDHNMTATILSDITEGEVSTSINLLAGDASLWDVALWDIDEWSAESSVLTNRIAEFQGIAKFFKIRLEQEGYDEGMEVLGLTMTSRVRRLQ